MARPRLGGFSAFFCIPFSCRLPSLVAEKWPQVGAWAMCFLVLIEQEEKLRKSVGALSLSGIRNSFPQAANVPHLTSH